MNEKPFNGFPLFAMGFRVFFLLAGLSALILMTLWNAMYHGQIHFNNYYPANIWHAHEMLLGFTSAVIAGFLLTAVKNWTGVQTVNSEQLAMLCLLWLYGRITPFYANLLPNGLIALVDLIFLPMLIFFIAKPILKTGNFKNLLFVGLLFLMILANVFIHLQILDIYPATAQTAINLLISTLIMLILATIGRLLPFFTERGLSGVICIRNDILDMSAIVTSLVALILFSIDGNGWILALIAIAAMICNLLRISGWYDRRIWFVPLLWILYLGYAWIILGFALMSLAAMAWIPQVLVVHAFTLGGIGVLTLGMMARVSLGHTGRALKVSNVVAISFLLINLAAIFRVLIPAILPAWYSSFLLISSYSWLAAFSLFLFKFLPIVCMAKADNQPG